MKCVSLYRVFFVVLFFLFCHVPCTYAGAPQIIASPSGILNIDQSFALTATMSGLSKNAIYRLRIAFALPGTTDYFGSTFDGTNWHAGSISGGNFVAVTTDASGSWWGNVIGEVDGEDPSLTTGSGTYDLKIGRYTQTGTTATWSDPVSVSLFVPTPTSLPPTTTPSPTVRVPTAIPTPIKVITPTIRVTPVKVPSIFVSPSIESSDSAHQEVLGTASAKISPPIVHTISQKPQTANVPVIFIVVGSIIVLAGIGGGVWIYIRQRQAMKHLS